MATEETVQLNEAHAPQQASIDAFNSILTTLKHDLANLRRQHDSMLLISRPHYPAPANTLTEHEPEYFQAAKDLSDEQLTSFNADNLESVRVAVTAYGLHLFGKVKIPALDNGYIHVRIFGSAKEGTDGSTSDEIEHKVHSIHTEEVVKEDGDRKYRAIFGKNDALEWFET